MNTNEHKAFYLKKLGQKEFDKLAVRAATPDPNVDEKLICIGLKLELQRLKDERKVVK